MTALVIALVLNVVAFFYLKAWRPVVNFAKAIQLNRQIKAYRCAGLLVLVLAASLAHGQQVVPSAGYSDGDTVLAQKFQNDTIAHDRVTDFVEAHWLGLIIACAAIFLFLQFGGGREADETNIHEQLDPDYRTGFTSDYHGDDAFEVPDGMHSEHMPVPVRSRSAAAGR